jgi:hypothetical protein
VTASPTASTPAALLRDRVEALHAAGDQVTVVTDAESYADRVLIGLRVAGASLVMTVSRAEYDGLAILRLIGCRDEPVKPAPNHLPKTSPRKTA